MSRKPLPRVPSPVSPVSPDPALFPLSLCPDHFLTPLIYDLYNPLSLLRTAVEVPRCQESLLFFFFPLRLVKNIKVSELALVANAFNPSTWKVKAAELMRI